MLLCGVFMQSSAVAAQVADGSRSESRLVLRLHDDAAFRSAAGLRAALTPAQRFEALLAELRVDDVTVERVLGGDILVVRFAPGVSAARAQSIRAQLQAHPALLYAEPDGRVHPVLVPADPLRAGQWFHYEAYGVAAYSAWDRTRGSASVTMALLDSGILPHVDLNPTRILPGYDFVSNPAYSNDGNGFDADPSDPGDAVAAGECGAGTPAEASSWHGLHLAGIMLAEIDNGVGVAGLDHGARLLPVRVLGKCGGTYADIIAGILWAAGLPGSGGPPNPNPARVINLSFAAPQACAAGIQDAINRAVAAGVTVVAAAGNGYGDDVAQILPAGCSNVIAVSASTRGGDVAAFSNVGARVLLSAPGGDGLVADNGILSTYNTGVAAPGADDYAYLAGTSVASAQVTAGVSLLLSVRPALTVSDIRTVLSQSAQPFPAGACPAHDCGAGILDLNAAVGLAQVYVPTPADPTTGSGEAGGGGGGGCTLQADRGGSFSYDVGWLLMAVAGAARLLRRARAA